MQAKPLRLTNKKVGVLPFTRWCSFLETGFNGDLTSQASSRMIMHNPSKYRIRESKPLTTKWEGVLPFKRWFGSLETGYNGGTATTTLGVPFSSCRAPQRKCRRSMPKGTFPSAWHLHRAQVDCISLQLGCWLIRERQLLVLPICEIIAFFRVWRVIWSKGVDWEKIAIDLGHWVW